MSNVEFSVFCFSVQLNGDGKTCSSYDSFLLVSQDTAVRGFDLEGSHSDAMVPIASSSKYTWCFNIHSSFICWLIFCLCPLLMFVSIFRVFLCFSASNVTSVNIAYKKGSIIWASNTPRGNQGFEGIFSSEVKTSKHDTITSSGIGQLGIGGMAYDWITGKFSFSLWSRMDILEVDRYWFSEADIDKLPTSCMLCFVQRLNAS